MMFPSFQNCARYEKYLEEKKHNSLHFVRNCPRIFCQGTLYNSFSEQIMSVDKFPSLFLLSIEAVFKIYLEIRLITHIFIFIIFSTRAW